MTTKTNQLAPSSVELKTLSTLRSEMQLVQIALDKASNDIGSEDALFYQNVRDYLKGRIDSIAGRLQ